MWLILAGSQGDRYHEPVDAIAPISKFPSRLRPLSGSFRVFVDGLRVITVLLAVRSFLLLSLTSGQQRPGNREIHDKTFPYLAYTTRYTDNANFAGQMMTGKILQC
jgi:hypothetical protein